MKKAIVIIIYMLLFSVLSFGQNNTEVSNEKNTILESEIEKNALTKMNFALYRRVTAKSCDKFDSIKISLKTNPRVINTSIIKLDTILSQIESSIKADVDIYSSHNGEPNNNIIFKSNISLTDLELLEYKNNFFGTSFINSYNINAHILNYDLTDEKNKKIELFSDKLGKGSSLETKKGGYNKLIIKFITDINKNYKYKSVKGYIEIEVEMITKFNLVEIHEKDKSNFMMINNQKVKILEFDKNIFHYKIFSSEEQEFETYINRCYKMGFTQ